MNRQKNTSNEMQKKVSRSLDRAGGRAGMRAAHQKATKTRQRGGQQQHELDTVHLHMNKRPKNH